MGQLDGQVAFITGAARGQGRSHAISLAEEGADIIGVDICAQIGTVNYPMAKRADLDETVRLVEKTGQRMLGIQADVRDRADLASAFEQGVGELGLVSIVLANAGIMTHSMPPHPASEQEFTDSLDVLLFGVWNTLQVSVPSLIEQDKGGAIVITASAAGTGVFPTEFSGGYDGYIASKYGVIGLMKSYAAALAKHRIRVNAVSPTGVDSPMISNDFFPAYISANPDQAASMVNPLPVEMIELIDVSRAVLYLVGESGRYVTGVSLPVDAGLTM